MVVELKVAPKRLDPDKPTPARLTPEKSTPERLDPPKTTYGIPFENGFTEGDVS